MSLRSLIYNKKLYIRDNTPTIRGKRTYIKRGSVILKVSFRLQKITESLEWSVVIRLQMISFFSDVFHHLFSIEFFLRSVDSRFVLELIFTSIAHFR